MRRFGLAATIVTATSLCPVSCRFAEDCEPGMTEPCPCPEGGLGSRACRSDGNRWGGCECDSARPTEGAARSAGPPPSEAAPRPASSQGDPAERALASKVAEGLLRGWESGRFEPLTVEFSEEMRRKLSPDAQRRGHDAVKATFGTFETLAFVETVSVGPYRAYRFKGDFTNARGELAPEVRVVIDDQGKVDGFWCRPWARDISGPMPGAGDGARGDALERALAERTANRFLKGWDAGRYEPLGEEFSEEMRAKFPPLAQKAGHATTAAAFGDFLSLDFVEMVPMGALRIYRFRGAFAKAQDDARPEVRVVIDGDGKVAGFFARPWSPTMM